MCLNTWWERLKKMELKSCQWCPDCWDWLWRGHTWRHSKPWWRPEPPTVLDSVLGMGIWSWWATEFASCLNHSKTLPPEKTDKGSMGEEISLFIIVITMKIYNLVLIKKLKTLSLEVNYASGWKKYLDFFFLCFQYAFGAELIYVCR